MAQRVLETPHCSVQMEAIFSQINRISRKGTWAEHFNSVLNRTPSINEDAIDILPQLEFNVLLDEIPTVMETRKTIQQQLLSSDKASELKKPMWHSEDCANVWERNGIMLRTN